MRKNDKQTTKTNHKQGRARRGINYRPVQDAAGGLVDWLLDIAADDVKGWREGERRLGDVRRYLHAKIRGEDAREPSHDAVLFAGTQLARAFANDPRVAAGMTALASEVEPLLPMMLASLTRATSGGMPPCAAPLGVMPVRPPGVPLSVPVPRVASRTCFHLRSV